jgi:hypothetical protein
MATKYSEEEIRIINCFNEVKTNNKELIYNGHACKVLLVDKPHYRHGGEGKTDIYLLLNDGISDYEVKCSSKMSNAEFLENKLKPERAEAIFGENWSKILSEYSFSLKDKFESLSLYNEEKNSCTLGYRTDITTKSRTLAKEFIPSPQEKREILLGEKLEENKRNVEVAGNLIKNAGVATHILLNSEYYKNAQDILDNLLTPEEVDLKCYITFCAVNYYIDKDRCESRPLGVNIDWSSGEPNIIYDEPLKHTSQEMRDILKRCL